MSKQSYYTNIQNYLQLLEEADAVLDWYHTNIEKVRNYENIYASCFDLDKGVIEYTGTDFGGNAHYSYELDIRYLWDSEFKSKKKLEVDLNKKISNNIEVAQATAEKALLRKGTK